MSCHKSSFDCLDRGNIDHYQVENGHDRDGLGSEENYFWKTAKERKETNDRKPFEPELG